MLVSCTSASRLLLLRCSSSSPSRSLACSVQQHRRSCVPQTRTRSKTSYPSSSFAMVTAVDSSSTSTSSSFPPPPPPSSAAAVQGLEPPLLWQHFLTLSSLPRPSKKEEAVVRWLKAFAEERKGKARGGLELREDKAGNVLIFRPGSGGGEDA